MRQWVVKSNRNSRLSQVRCKELFIEIVFTSIENGFHLVSIKIS